MKLRTGNSNVLVIGAGIGGITAAARLAREGYKVTVLEKNALPGGRVNRLTVDGYTFDTGATIFLMPELYARAFADLGERMEDYLDLRRIDPTYRLIFQDDSQLLLTSDLHGMQSQMEAIEPGSFGRMLRYLEEAGRHYRISMDHIVQRDFRNFAQFASPANLLRFLQLRTLVPHSRYTATFFRDPRLQMAFTFQDLYMALSPYNSPATYSLLQYAELADGLWYPRGGMYGIVEALIAIAVKRGVTFRFDAPVDRILVDGKRATGVALASGEALPADLVVANADLGYVYRHLLPADGTANRIDRMEYGCSTVTFYWGIDRQYPDMGPHNVIFSGDYRRNFDAVLKEGTLADEPNFYLHTTSRLDPSTAPPGHDAWVIAVPVGNIRADGSQDWPAIQSRARQFVLRRLAQAGLEDVESHITVERGFLPEDWRNRYNLTRGASHGLSHKLFQMGYFRPHNRHDRYRNLYFTGASTHPGTSVPMVLNSSRFVVERIIRENSE
jgi:phytoene desaturase